MVNCACTLENGKVTSMCGAHHNAAWKMYGEELEKLKQPLQTFKAKSEILRDWNLGTLIGRMEAVIELFVKSGWIIAGTNIVPLAYGEYSGSRYVGAIFLVKNSLI